MRLLLKLAFLIGLALFFLAPSRDGQDELPNGLSAGALVFAVQQAVSDIGGFCERSPLACESGRDALAFAGARVAEGLTFVYGLASGAVAGEPERTPRSAPAPAMAPSTDEPALAGQPSRVDPAAPPPPRPYTAPEA